MVESAVFERERPRLLRTASRVLSDPVEAEDVVQTVWIRLHHNRSDIDNLPAWLTTVTTRLCLDRLRAKSPQPAVERELADTAPDPAEVVETADAIGVALQVVLDRLTPDERVAFVLHDNFGIDFATIAEILGNTPVAARKLASRARTRLAKPIEREQPADWAIVDAFLAAARGADLARLMELLAPDAVVVGDPAAVALGTPARIDGRRRVSEIFNGAAKAALPVFIADRPGAAWVHRGATKVAFDFTISDGLIRRIDFRADPDVLAQVTRRARGRRPVGAGPASP